ncbi:leukocyte elastase inhibitor-like [Penaeus indicus]|uniref:leukocyte elastase inhibitor-like n=1 Tax=Penaeus indicus TaxID=29960 RepID=UPI00300C3C9C
MRLYVVMAVVLGVGVGVALPGPLEPTLRFHSKRQAGPGLGDLIQEFALDISSVSWGEQGNMVFSPFSITSLLSMLLLGTSGTTYHELRSALLYPATAEDSAVHTSYQTLTQSLIQDNPGMIVSIANRLYLQTGVNVLAAFSQDAQRYYGISVRELNFAQNPTAARDAINTWVSKETRNKIPRLLNFVSPQTTALAVNTVYFKGAWETPFQKRMTHSGTFNTGTQNISVPMMSAIMKVPYLDLPDANAEMIALPYQGRQFAMFFIVPRGPVTLDTLLELEFYLDADTLNRHIRSMRDVQMNVFVPRMSINYKADLADTLKRLKVTSLFDAVRGDFSRMTTDKVMVDRVIHETIIDITEEGTEAAAATATDLNRIGTSRSFAVDRPALLFIRELRTGAPLFWGRLVQPDPLFD